MEARSAGAQPLGDRARPVHRGPGQRPQRAGGREGTQAAARDRGVRRHRALRRILPAKRAEQPAPERDQIHRPRRDRSGPRSRQHRHAETRSPRHRHRHRRATCRGCSNLSRRSRPAISRRFEGAGLGLAFARKCVELGGARISAASRKGEGSTFTIAFPRACEIRRRRALAHARRIFKAISR